MVLLPKSLAAQPWQDGFEGFHKHLKYLQASWIRCNALECPISSSFRSFRLIQNDKADFCKPRTRKNSGAKDLRTPDAVSPTSSAEIAWPLAWFFSLLQVIKDLTSSSYKQTIYIAIPTYNYIIYLYIPLYTFIYLYIPLYTFIYLYILYM